MMQRGFWLSLLMGLLLAQATPVRAQPDAALDSIFPTQTLRALWRKHVAQPDFLARYYEELDEKHLVERHPTDKNSAIVTYFAKGDEHTDYLLQSGGPDFYGLRFQRFGESNFFFCTQTIPSDAWFSYGVNRFSRTPVAGQPKLFKTDMEHIIDGAVIGPDAPLSPAVSLRSEVDRGAQRELRLDSVFLGQKRSLNLYLPAGFEPSESYPLLIQLDGERYTAPPAAAQPWQAWTPLATILDNLIADQHIRPTIAVMVPNQGDRNEALINDGIADFLAIELVPWLQRELKTPGFSKIVVSGPSRAGFAALRTGLKHADVIDGVLAQSGSFYYTRDGSDNWPVYPAREGWLLERLRNMPAMPLDVYLEVGLYDLGLGRVGTNRQLRDILTLKGYDVAYREFNGGHSHLNWRHTLPEGMRFFFSPALPEAQPAGHRAD